VIVVSCPQRAERVLQAGTMSCPRCKGRLRPYGHGRMRTVRGLGGSTVSVRPRRARCADCSATHILLPTELTVRRADSTEVIGNALAAKANGAGFRTIAARLDRPPSTVRRWLRRAPQSHAQWLYERAVEHAARVDRELLVRPAPHKTPLGYALNLLAGAALRYRERLGLTDPPWTLIGLFAQGRLLAPPRIT
jgi:transposase-like protein